MAPIIEPSTSRDTPSRSRSSYRQSSISIGDLQRENEKLRLIVEVLRKQNQELAVNNCLLAKNLNVLKSEKKWEENKRIMWLQTHNQTLRGYLKASKKPRLILNQIPEEKEATQDELEVYYV